MRFFKKKPRYGWFKSNLNWENTKAKCTGYDNIQIAKNTLEKAKNYTPNYQELLPYSLLFYIMQIAKEKDVLNVIDFGGGFGVLYKQVKRFLDDKKIIWNVVEQKSYVDLSPIFGEINFFEWLDEPFGEVDIVIASGVLQYLEDYKMNISHILQRKPKYIFIDRLPIFTKSNRKNTIAIQKVPPDFYGFEVSYPCWIFEEKKFLEQFNQYEMISRFYSHQDCRNNIVIDKSGVDMVGYFFKLK